MTILVIDLELNQPSEKIIELGYVIGDPISKNILLKRSILIDPLEKLSLDIIKLTNITQEMVDGSSSLRDAYKTMMNDLSHFNTLPLIHQWGIPDAFLLRNQLNDSNLWKFGRRWIDIKALYQTYAIINSENFHGGLRKSAAKIGIRMSKEEAHRADYDAEISFYVYCDLAKRFIVKNESSILNKPPSYRFISGSIHNFSHAFVNNIVKNFNEKNEEIKFQEYIENLPEKCIKIFFIPKLEMSIAQPHTILIESVYHFNDKIDSFFSKNSTSSKLLDELSLNISVEGKVIFCKISWRDNRNKIHSSIVKI